MNPILLIPAHNEAPSLAPVIEEARALHPDLPILVVDDASTDDTARVLSAFPVRRLTLCVRLGLGGAVAAGLTWARRLGHDTVIRIDADGQHPPRAIAALLAALGPADVVVGSRFLAPGAKEPGLGKRLARRVLARALSLLTRQKVTDPTSGFWAFGPRAVALLADHHPTGYGEPELLLLLARNGLKVAEVPTEMRPRLAGRSTLTWPRVLLALARALLALIVVPLRTRVNE